MNQYTHRCLMCSDAWTNLDPRPVCCPSCHTDSIYILSSFRILPVYPMVTQREYPRGVDYPKTPQPVIEKEPPMKFKLPHIDRRNLEWLAAFAVAIAVVACVLIIVPMLAR